MAILAVALALAGCVRDHFALIDPESGIEVGRFTYRTGEIVNLPGGTYQIKKIGSHCDAVETQLKLTIIPEFCARQAHAMDITSFVDDCLIEYGPTNSSPHSITVDTVVHPDRTRPVPLLNTFAFGVRNISAFDLLKQIAKETDGELVIDGRHVYIEYKK